MKQQFLEDQADTIRLTVYAGNRPSIPTSANITLYDPAGGTLQAQTSATVNSTTGEMTYSLTSTHTADADLNYKAVWDYVISGTTYYETQLFDVVKSRLSIPIVDDDIFAELGSLREAWTQQTGTATAGASSTLTDTTNRKEPDDYWKGGNITILSGTGAGQSRVVTGFTQSTSVINVTPDWVTTPDTTSVYKVVRSFSDKIQQSFKKIETELYNKGKRHELILESSQIEIPLIYLTVSNVCDDLSTEVDDKWHVLGNKYMDRYKESFNNMSLEYDEDDSGFIDATDEEQQNLTSFRIFRT